MERVYRDLVKSINEEFAVANTKNRMRVGVSLHSYVNDLRSHKLTIDDAIRHVKSCGGECIELVDAEHLLGWPRPTLTELFHLKELIESLGLVLANFSQYTEREYSAEYSCSEDDMVDQVRESILVAHLMGAPMTRLTPFPNIDPAKNNVIARSLPIAEKYGVQLTLEIHSPMRPERFLEVLRQFDSPYLGIVPDFSAWYRKGGLSIDSFKECLCHARHVHGKATSAIPLDGDDPNIPYRALCSALKEAQYDGTIVVEFEPPGFGKSGTGCATGVESVLSYIRQFK
jgi:Sugar phosphate isomerases/epimerases